jgi:hypothetical protein
MFLVHETKNQDGKWEVAWMWLPHFLAADRNLHRHVGEGMTEAFKGEVLDPEAPADLMMKMHDHVIRLILEKYPIPGLRQYLESTVYLDPSGQEETA